MTDQEHTEVIEVARRAFNAAVKAAQKAGLKVTVEIGSSDGNDTDMIDGVWVSREFEPLATKAEKD